jgi:ADP-heptose:LPS heptosyltransferase
MGSQMSRRGTKRVLVVVRGHLGDVVQSFPALRDLRRSRPQAHITVMLNEYVGTALDDCPYVDEVIPGFAYRPRGLLRTAAHLRLVMQTAGRFDTVIAMRWSPSRMPILAFLSGASVRVGYSREGRLGRLLTHNLGREPFDTVSNRIINQIPLQALGIETTSSYPVIDWLPDHIRAQTSDLLESHGIGQETPFAVIQISSHWGCNEWRSDKWAALSDFLHQRHGLKVVVTGTSEWFEQAKFESVKRRCRTDLVSLHGQTPVPQLFEIVQRARLVVAVDSGLAQIALAQRTPSVILFGIEEIEANGPLPQEKALMRTLQRWDRRRSRPNKNCAFGHRHCHGRFCAENYSLRNISVEDVAEEVDDLLLEPALAYMRAT